jgi:hypothetical protein
MSSIERIKKGIESDITDWEERLKDEGYTKEEIENFLLKLSPETVKSIKKDPTKMAEIIDDLLKKQQIGDENYIKDEELEYEDKERQEGKSFVERIGK